MIHPNLVNTYPVFPCALVVLRPRSSHGKSANTIHSPHLLLVSRLISLGYQPPLFPEVEADVTVPSVQHHLWCSWCIWAQTQEALPRTVHWQRHYLDRLQMAAPRYEPGQKEWLTAKEALSFKFTPHFIDPSVVRLDLPASMHIHPMFQVSQVKLVHNNPFLEGKLEWQLNVWHHACAGERQQEKPHRNGSKHPTCTVLTLSQSGSGSPHQG